MIGLPIQTRVKGVCRQQQQAITNAFNKYFVQVGPRLANNIHNTTDPLTYVTSSVSSIFIPEVGENGITEVVQSLKIIVVLVRILGRIGKPLIQFVLSIPHLKMDFFRTN